eukprot:CAMPEP_0181115010 /NCGR_PEP_ID=MMETSP1071-20121207/21205_1 /TAXON_ID=35127 /ORGANISM="Thalassiosira sp., Strain NH16" /LENGTH=254 /DNA_ID=CAMNT_0023199191 /DNA_START=514 /DNA_END=1278 /DNA_ORIENTATION=+
MPIHAPIGNPDELSGSDSLTEGGGSLISSSSVASFGLFSSSDTSKNSSSNIGVDCDSRVSSVGSGVENADCDSWVLYVGSGVKDARTVFILNVGSMVTTGLLVGGGVGARVGQEFVQTDAELQYIIPGPHVPNCDRQCAVFGQGDPMQGFVPSPSILKALNHACWSVVGDGDGAQNEWSFFVGGGVRSGVGGFIIATGAGLYTSRLDFPTFPDFDPSNAFADLDLEDLPDFALVRYILWAPAVYRPNLLDLLET